MKRALTFVVVVLLGLIAVYATLVILNAPSPRARKAWKESAIAQISSRLSDPSWVTNRIAVIRKQTSGEENSDAWLTQDLVLMNNGDWLAYANVCQKENRPVSDLFLACGSDGQWYYSSYHFCKGMIVLKGEDQPPDLPAFIKTYYLRAFDGRSDDCLQKTWPPPRQP